MTNAFSLKEIGSGPLTECLRIEGWHRWAPPAVLRVEENGPTRSSADGKTAEHFDGGGSTKP